MARNDNGTPESLDDGRITFRDIRTLDPVCGAPVDIENRSALAAAHDGTIHYFCSDTCRRKFQKSPYEYAIGL